MPNKKNISSVEDLSEKLSKAQSIYFTNYLGLNVSDVTSLRKKFYPIELILTLTPGPIVEDMEIFSKNCPFTEGGLALVKVL